MIAWICIAEACMSFNALIEVLNPLVVICYVSSYKILAFTFFNGEESYLKYANMQCQSNQIFYAFFQLISLTLNMCLCFDLIMTIYDPFSPAKRRTKWYYGCSLASSVLLVLIIFGLDTSQNNSTVTQYDCINSTDASSFAVIQQNANLVLAMTLSLYIVVAIYSTVYSYRRLYRPGVSAPVRNLFLKKHFLYVIVFIVIWMIQQSNNYYYLFNPQQQTVDSGDTPANSSAFNSLHMLGKQLGFPPRGGANANAKTVDAT